jgi:exosome complex RNA-binding protein Rrp42 (RNase PH superfamily)
MNGCLQESASLAVLGALLSFRRPNAYIDPDTNELVLENIQESTPIKLHLFHLPILTSFALCNGILLAEPNYEEEEVIILKANIVQCLYICTIMTFE